MSKITSELYNHFLPVFKERTKFNSMIDNIVGSRTFFEDYKFFFKMHGHSALGRHYYQQEISNRIVDAGSHIKLYLSPGKTIVHEYGREMHFQSCDHKIAPFCYEDYDMEMKEVMAYATEREIIGKRKVPQALPKIHKTASELLNKLEQNPEFANKPFHEQWKLLLQFKKHKILKYFINISEKDDKEKIAILKKNGFSWWD